MTKQPLVIGLYTFPTKGACSEYCKQMLASYVVGDTVDPDDEEFLRALIERHPEADDKIGTGIDHFFIGANEAGSYHGFRILRTDGTVMDFSYRSCVSGKSPAPSTSARRALRHAVVQQILDFRSTQAPVCAVTGLPLTPDIMHIDHEEPNTFTVLVDRFLALNGITIDDVQSESRGEGCMLSDRDFASRWAAFHRQHAKLRVVHKHINMGWPL